MRLAEMTARNTLAASGGPYHYRAYGLAIVSDLYLPELEPDTPRETSDLAIRMRPTGRPAPQDHGENTFEFTADHQFMCWPMVGAFMIRGLSVIDVERAPGVSDQLLPFPLLGPVMAMLLHLRGLLILHSSAVEVGGRGAVFLGDKMAGKSTTAAAFVRAGHKLLTDDVLAVDVSNAGAIEIIPGFPQIKLAEDAEKAVVIEGSEYRPLVVPDFEKRQQRLSAGFTMEQVEPAALYVLVRGTQAKATRLSPTDALSAAIQFSYITRFASRALPTDQARDHLRQCATLVGATAVYRLEAPTGLERLDEVVRLVERQLA